MFLVLILLTACGDPGDPAWNGKAPNAPQENVDVPAPLASLPADAMAARQAQPKFTPKHGPQGEWTVHQLDWWEITKFQYPVEQSCWDGPDGWVGCWARRYSTTYLQAWHTPNDSGYWRYLVDARFTIAFKGIFDYRWRAFPMRCKACAFANSQSDERCATDVQNYPATWVSNQVTFAVPGYALAGQDAAGTFSWGPGWENGYFTLECWFNSGGPFKSVWTSFAGSYDGP
jgi:hypothetical protein